MTPTTRRAGERSFSRMLGRMRRSFGFIACLLLGCAGRAPHPVATPPRQEIVDDEGSVVHAGPAASPGNEPRALPALPAGIDEKSSTALGRGLEPARALLDANGPAAPPDDQAGYDAWLKTELSPWLEGRGRALEAVLALLREVPAERDPEQTVTAALVGLLYARTHAQLLAVPPPPPVRADPKLLHIYRDQVNKTSAEWAESAAAALRRCATLAAAQRDASFVAWLDRCQSELARLELEARDAQALEALVQAESTIDEPAVPAIVTPAPAPNPTQ